MLRIAIAALAATLATGCSGRVPFGGAPPAPDSGGPDAPVSGPAPAGSRGLTITFAHERFAGPTVIETIGADGRNRRPHPAFAGADLGRFTLSAVLVGRSIALAPYERDAPYQARENAKWGHIRLPGGRGFLSAYGIVKPTARSGLMRIGHDGSIERLYSRAGLGAYAWAVSDDGALAAAAFAADATVALVRTDGKTFAGGQRVVVLRPTPAPHHIVATSVTLTSRRVFFVGRTSADRHPKETLYHASLDGSTMVSAVTLPKASVDGVLTAAAWIEPDLVPAGAGVLLVGRYTSHQGARRDVFYVSERGAVTNVSKHVAAYGSRGTYTAASHAARGATLAASPSGAHAAYLQNVAPYPSSSENLRFDLYVAATDGRGAAVRVMDGSNASHPKIGGRLIFNLRWLDDRTLFFNAGPVAARQDLFRYDVPTNSLYHLTGATPAVATRKVTFASDDQVNTAWRSPSRRTVLVLVSNESERARGAGRLLAIDTRTWRVRTAMTETPDGPFMVNGFDACDGGKRIFIPRWGDGRRAEVWTIDGEGVGPARRVTRVGATLPRSFNVSRPIGFVANLACNAAAATYYAERPGVSRGDHFPVWGVSISGSTYTPTRLSPDIPRYAAVLDTVVVDPRGDFVAWAAHTRRNDIALYVARTAGGPAFRVYQPANQSHHDRFFVFGIK